MEKRFTAGMAGALALHAVLLLAAFRLNGAHDRAPALAVSPAAAIEVSVFADEGSEGMPAGLGSSAEEPSPASAKPRRSGARVQFARTGDSESAIASAGLDEMPGDVSELPHEPPRRIDLGLDGSIMRSAVLDSSRRPPPRRQVVVMDGWSESAVRLNAELAAPREGSALLTLEWDSEGRLQSIATSGHPPDQTGWRKLADKLRPLLVNHPRRPDRGRGLRLVYLVRSEVVRRPSEGSQLPRSDYASLDTITDELLPPAPVLTFGVRADTSTPGERVVSVTLASSQVL